MTSYYKPYISGSDSDSETESIASSISFSNDTGNFALLANNLLIPPIRGPVLDLSSEVIFLQNRNYALYNSLADTISKDLSNNMYVPLQTNTLVNTVTQITSIINMDSTNRDKQVYPQPTNLQLRLPRTYKNIVNFQVVQIKLLSAFYYFRKSKQNITITINEQGQYLYPDGSVVTGSDITNPAVTKVLNKITNTIREGSYDILSLINELTIQLNTTPIFYDFVGGFNQFVLLFAPTGDLSLGFNLPGDYYYDSVINNYISNPTIDTIVTKYFAQRYAGKTGYTINEIKVAYYYPVLKEILLDDNYTGTEVDLSNSNISYLNPGETPYTRCVYYFQGLDDPYVQSVIASNVNVLDTYRLKHTFRYSLVNKYVVSYDTFSQHITINTPSLNTSLVNLITGKQTTYFNQQLAIYNLTATQFADLTTQNTLLLAILTDMYNYLQTQFALSFAINFNTFTLDYYGQMSNYVYLRNGSNASGVSSTYDVNVITSGKDPISNNLPTFYQKAAPAYWPGLASNASTNFSGSTNVTYFSGNPFNIQTDSIESYHSLINSTNIYCPKLLNHVDTVVNIDNTSYTVFKFKSGLRQTLQVETLPRPTKYRYPEYNATAYDIAIQNLFNNTYTYQYNQSNVALINSSIAVTPIPGFTALLDSNFGISLPASIALWSSPAVVSVINQERCFSFIPPLPAPISGSVPAYKYTMGLNISAYPSGNFPAQLNVFTYRDAAAFYADISGFRAESSLNYLTSNLIGTDVSSATIFFNTYQTSSTKYYVIVRSQTTGPALTNFILAPYFPNGTSYVATSNSLTNFNPLANPQLNLNNFLYSRSYDTDYVALPSYSSLYQQNPLVNTLFSNIGYSNLVPLGYDASGVSTDLTNYIGYIQNQPLSNNYPYSILHVDPINGYVFKKGEEYNPVTQNYFYTNTTNKLYTSNSVAAHNPGTPAYRQFTQTQYYSSSYIPNTPNQPPLESTFISPYIGAYNTSDVTNTLVGYTFDLSGMLLLGNGVYGLSLIPGQGTWDIQRYMFRSVFNQSSWSQSNIYGYTSDPNLNISHLGVFYANVLYGKDIGTIALSNCICALKFSGSSVYNSSNTDFGFGSEGGSFYEFTRDSNYGNGEYLYGFTECPNSITNDYNDAYVVLAFDAYGTTMPFIGLAGSIVPYPYYSDAVASSTYIDGTPSSNGAYVIRPTTKAVPDANRAPPTGISPSQCQYEQSMTIGTTFQAYMCNSPDMVAATMHAYSNLGTVVDRIVMDISGFMLTQTSEFSLYSYDTTSNRSFTLENSFTIDQIFSPPNSNITFISVAANENVYAFLALSNSPSLTIPLPNSNTLSSDKILIRTYNPNTGIVLTALETELLIYPAEATEIQSFTYNNFGGFTLGFQYIDSNVSTINVAYSLASAPATVEASFSTLQKTQCIVSSMSYAQRFITYQNPREDKGAFYVADVSGNIGEFSYIQPTVPSIYNPAKHIKANATSNYVYSGSPCKITSYAIDTHQFDSLAITRDPVKDIIYGFALSNPNHFYELTSYTSPVLPAYDSNAIFTISLALPQAVKEMEAGYNGALWFNDTNTIYGNRNILTDGIVHGLQYAWQIFYPVQRVIYKNVSKSVDLLNDLSGLTYPELAHTELFFYKNKSSFIADLSNSSVKSTWGLESNYYISDTQFSGYYFNAYSTFIPLENTTDEYYLAVRNYSPTEKSQVYMRFSLPNRYDYGYASMIDISNEIVDSLTSTQYNPNYSLNLASFNSNFVFASKTFGNNIVPGFYGVTLTNVTGFGDFMKYYQQYYNNYQSNIAIQNAINLSVKTSLSNFISTDLAYIIPSTAAVRQRYTDPLLFSILWKSSLTPQYAPLEDQWGLGWNLGYAKEDTPYNVIQIATSFYKILDDYITLQLNQEININRVDTGAKENIASTHEPTGETNSYYGKMLLAPFGSYAQTMIMNPISFNPPLGRLDKLSFSWQDLAGITIDNSDCEWNAVIQIVENQTIVQTIVNPPVLIPR